MKEIQFKTSLTRKQYFKLVFYLMRVYFICLVAAATYFSLIVLIDKKNDFTLAWIFLAALLFLMIRTYFAARRNYSECVSEWKITEEYLIRNTSVLESKLKYEGVYNVVETRDYILVHPDERNVWVIPKGSLERELLNQVKSALESKRELFIRYRKR